MKDVAGNGRTVLFVSHNMIAVKSLCQNALLLKDGLKVAEGPVVSVIDEYMKEEQQTDYVRSWPAENAPGSDMVKMLAAKVTSPDLQKNGKLTVDSEIDIEFEFENHIKAGTINISVHFCTLDGNIVFAAPSNAVNAPSRFLKFKCHIPAHLLNAVRYKLDVVYVNASASVYNFNDCVNLDIREADREGAWYGNWVGGVRPKLEWQQSATETRAENP